MQEFKSEDYVLFGVVLVLVVLGSFLTLGIAGARTVAGIIIIMFLPFYLIFSNFSISKGEKILFSIFTSIVLFPSLVYWLGFVVPFRMSIIIVFMALLITAFLFKKFLNKQLSSQT